MLGIGFASSAAPAGNSADGIQRGHFFSGTSAVKSESAKEFKLAVLGTGTNRLVIGVIGNTDLSLLTGATLNQSVKNGNTTTVSSEHAFVAPSATGRRPFHPDHAVCFTGV
ncbi:MAG: hypothetical protein EXS27_06330 [Pedosphaera sp.]|nr:hypothetical protein [Pedosphaera sp.]